MDLCSFQVTDFETMGPNDVFTVADAKYNISYTVYLSLCI